jgi:hypothetical protein
MTEDRETVLPSVRSGHSEQFIILSSYAEKKSSYRDFQISCVRNMLALNGRARMVPVRNTTKYCH